MEKIIIRRRRRLLRLCCQSVLRTTQSKSLSIVDMCRSGNDRKKKDENQEITNRSYMSEKLLYEYFKKQQSSNLEDSRMVAQRTSEL